MALTFDDLWQRALAGTLTDRSISVNLGRGNISALEAQVLRGIISGSMTPAEALNILAGATPPTAALTPTTMEAVLRLAAAGTAWTADMWRMFILTTRRALPELESPTPNIGDGQNITFLRNWWARIRSEVLAGNASALVAEAEAPLAAGGWTNGDLKLLYKVIAHNSQLNIFLSAIADASASGKSIQDAIGKNLGVYSKWLWHFSRWGQTWGTIVESFLGLVALVKKIKEGSLEAEDVWKYRDTEAFQATFEELENQQYLQDLRAWDPQEFLRLKPAYDSQVPGSEDEPLFWSPKLARFMTEEVFGGAIVVGKSNFLDHKRLAEEIRTRQRALRRALHVVETYVDQPQEMPFLPDLKPSSIFGAFTGLMVGVFGADLVGLPMDQGRSFLPAVILALIGWWVGSQLRRRLGVLESLVINGAVLVWGLWTAFFVGGVKAAHLKRGIPAAQTTWKIVSTLPKGWGLILLVAIILLFLIRRAKRG